MFDLGCIVVALILLLLLPTTKVLIQSIILMYNTYKLRNRVSPTNFMPLSRTYLQQAVAAAPLSSCFLSILQQVSRLLTLWESKAGTKGLESIGFRSYRDNLAFVPCFLAFRLLRPNLLHFFPIPSVDICLSKLISLKLALLS